MTTDPEFIPYITAAQALGAEHGKAAGSWVIDGNSTADTCRKVLDDIESCEFDTPSPLSGEFADGMTIGRLASELGVDEASDDMDELCSAYEDSYHDAYIEEVTRAATYQVS